MNRQLLAILLAALAAGTASADQWVSGYCRRNGTYVPGCWRSTPDNSFWNNYSSWGNSNPYTGRKGYRLPSCAEYISNPARYGYTYRPVDYLGQSYSSGTGNPRSRSALAGDPSAPCGWGFSSSSLDPEPRRRLSRLSSLNTWSDGE